MIHVHLVWQRAVALPVYYLGRCEQPLLCQTQPLSLTSEDAVLYLTGILFPETTLVQLLNCGNL